METPAPQTIRHSVGAVESQRQEHCPVDAHDGLRWYRRTSAVLRFPPTIGIAGVNWLKWSVAQVLNATHPGGSPTGGWGRERSRWVWGWHWPGWSRPCRRRCQRRRLGCGGLLDARSGQRGRRRRHRKSTPRSPVATSRATRPRHSVSDGVGKRALSAASRSTPAVTPQVTPVVPVSAAASASAEKSSARARAVRVAVPASPVQDPPAALATADSVPATRPEAGIGLCVGRSCGRSRPHRRALNWR